MAVTVYKWSHGTPDGKVSTGREGRNPRLGKFPARTAGTHAERAALAEVLCACDIAGVIRDSRWSSTSLRFTTRRQLSLA